jgi:hypothetical protein
MYGHRLDSKFATRAQDAKCNFAAIGNDDFFEHTVLVRYASQQRLESESSGLEQEEQPSGSRLTSRASWLIR